MKAYHVARKNSTIFKSLTGLSVKQFDKLNKSYSRFHPSLNKLGRTHSLEESEHALFFILFYFRHYPTQQLFAFILRCDQSQISRWIKLFSVPLLKVSRNYISKGRRKINSLSKLQQSCPEVQLLIDATERPVQRPSFNQERVYSGKKKRHTIKNQIISDKENRLIYSVSKTYTGKTHDFKVFKYESLPKGTPKHIRILADTGYIGIENTVDNPVSLPNKASKNFPLTEAEKSQNSILSSHRVVVENIFAHMKNYHILAQKFRGSKNLAHDSFEIVAGIHNFKQLDKLS
ncbi:MAG: transposase [Ignavibacteriae bacterium]|nr:transposase [Ignavibacteriota bacterium]